MTTEAKRMLQRRDTTADWTATDPVLAQGEIAVELQDSTGVVIGLRVGDGTNHWSGLTDVFDLATPWLNVVDFGATGDGTTDDTAAFQAALDELGGLGGDGVLYVPPPPGDWYIVDGNLVAPDVGGIHLLGDGEGLSRIKFTAATGNGLHFNMSTPRVGYSIRGLTIAGSSATVPAKVLRFVNCYVVNLDHASFADGAVQSEFVSCGHVHVGPTCTFSFNQTGNQKSVNLSGCSNFDIEGTYEGAGGTGADFVNFINPTPSNSGRIRASATGAHRFLVFGVGPVDNLTIAGCAADEGKGLVRLEGDTENVAVVGNSGRGNAAAGSVGVDFPSGTHTAPVVEANALAGYESLMVLPASIAKEIVGLHPATYGANVSGPFTANMALFWEIPGPRRSCSLTEVLFEVTTTGDNICFAIYDKDTGARLATTGAFATPANGIRSRALLTSAPVHPGQRLVMGFSADGTTCRFRSMTGQETNWIPEAPTGGHFYGGRAAASHPLPSTLPALTAATTPGRLFGIAFR